MHKYLIENKIEAINNIILKVIYGSDVYGTTTGDSDNDLRGIYVPSVNAHISLYKYKTYESLTKDHDLVLHPIKKYIKLALNSNPSCIEWLFVPEDKILFINDAGRMLIDNRSIFLTKQIYQRYAGFARSETKRIYNITGRSGARRKALFEKYGYDPKAAMNVLRLLEEGTELLTTETLSMPRPNANLLKEIKQGKISLSKVFKYIYYAEKEIEKAYNSSKLPQQGDIEKANILLINIVRM